MPRKKIGNYHVFNIRIVSSDQATVESYTRLLRNLFESKIDVSARRPSYVMIRSMVSTEIEGVDVLSGQISRFTKIEGEDWLNRQTLEITSYEIPRNLLPNLSEAPYIFIPSAHRFILQVIPGAVSLTAAKKYLENGLRAVSDDDEEVQLDIEVDQDIIDRIINARLIKRLDIEVSYSNQDNNTEFIRMAEDQIRDGRISRLNVVGKAREGEGIDLDRAPFLKGAAQLSASNGHTEATIINEEGRREKIDTSHHPRKFRETAPNENGLKNKIVRKIIDTFRSNGS